MEDLKKRIAKRCAQEFKNGDFISLGIGLSTLVANYIPEDIDVILYSENDFSAFLKKQPITTLMLILLTLANGMSQFWIG